MGVEREFELSITASVAERKKKKKKKILCEGCGRGALNTPCRRERAAAQEGGISVVHGEAMLTALTGH